MFVEAEHLARVRGLAVGGGQRRHLGGEGVYLQARGARERRRRELDVDRGALDHLVLRHLLQLRIARVPIQLMQEVVLIERVMHVAV
jgi:hypothetical protein